MTSKMLHWKIQPNLMCVKTIQDDAVGRVFDCFYTSDRGGLDFQSNIFWVFGLTFQHERAVKVSGFLDKKSFSAKVCAMDDKSLLWNIIVHTCSKNRNG